MSKHKGQTIVVQVYFTNNLVDVSLGVSSLIKLMHGYMHSDTKMCLKAIIQITSNECARAAGPRGLVCSIMDG